MNDTQVFITGANGQLGQALKARYPGAQSADISELDITDRASISNYDWSNIKVLINAAAYTNVDGAETAEGRIAAWKVNATAVSYLVEAAREHDMTLVHVSSDYVFDGTQDPHTEDEPLSPLGVYGQSKAAGDIAVGLAPKHYLLRSSWVIGEGPNFVRTMLGLGAKGTAPTVVADQIGRLTFTSELVRIIDHLLSGQAPYGTYNASNSGESASWADITRTIFKEAGYDLQVSDTTTADYYAGKAGIAPRPLKSTLALNKLEATGFKPIDWREDLTKYIAKEKQA
ncbi:MAG TPA: NAD(P)-dependent oxidoreductase [Verrucomicrobiae bacterium]|nr:NAD(P)-dependent oxidoreductase [Verrucomicrobiae bacterium]